MKTRLGWSLVAGVIVSVICLCVAFRNVPFSQLIETLSTFRHGWVWPSTATVFAAMGLRVWRWQLILDANRRVGFWAAFHPMAIGFFINCFLPGRIGEVARPLILKQNSQVPFSEGLATVVVERFLDMIILVAMLIVTLMWVEIDPHLDIPVAGHHLNRTTLVRLAQGMSLMGLLLILGFFMLLFDAGRRILVRMVLACPRFLNRIYPAWTPRLVTAVSLPLIDMIERFAAGLSSLKRPGRLAGCMGLSVALWLVTVYSYQVLVFGMPGMTVGFIEMAAVMVIICFFIALPSVPGYWGVWEAAGVFGLALFGVPADIASAYTLVSHAVQLFPQILMGVVSLLVTGVRIRNVVTRGGGQPILEGEPHD